LTARSLAELPSSTRHDSCSATGERSSTDDSAWDSRELATRRGTTAQASAATCRLPTRWHSYLVTDSASPCLSRPPACAACDVCPHHARPTARTTRSE